MDNMIKKFNEELKYYFPESRLEAVLFEIPLSKKAFPIIIVLWQVIGSFSEHIRTNLYPKGMALIIFSIPSINILDLVNIEKSR